MTPEEFSARWGKVLGGEESFEDAKKRITSAPSQADTAVTSPTPKPAASGAKAYRQVKAQDNAQSAPATPPIGLDQGPPGFDEGEFQKWYRKEAAKTGIDPNPDSPEHHYDYRKAYMAGASSNEEGHWPSEFKTDDHPRRFLPVGPGGEWEDTRTGTPVRPPGMGSVRQFEDQNPVPGLAANRAGGPDYTAMTEAMGGSNPFMDAATSARAKIAALLKRAGVGQPIDEETQAAIKNIGMR